MEKLNIIAYLIYLSITFYITVIVGKNLYHHGVHYLKDIFDGNKDIYIPVNKILLTGYYLLNLGYAMYMLNSWEEITTKSELIKSIIENSGKIILILAVIHYNNLLTFSLVKKYNHKLFN
ncbi:MAG: hypothetical protein GY827_01735 [Cytophagales bacterium]|nr:hypothetical protein [Cytophagales bacterium]